MRVLASYPGRYGDLIWALPTIRALARRLDERIDLLIAGEFAPIVPLLERQDYLARVVADPAWSLSQGWQPPNREDVISPYDRVYHLGYRRWPELPLPFETWHTLHHTSATAGVPVPPIAIEELALHEPWITNLPAAPPTEIAIGFSECHFELKVGLVTLLENLDRPLLVLNHDSRTRWALERPRGGYPLSQPLPWVEMAAAIRNADVFLGCCSGLHVLAVAIGTPVVIVEPMEARWNDIFFPLGKHGPQVHLVMGNDNRPTFDARAVRETLEKALRHD
jgi:hypothetical protein